ncbi:hypothetical protein I302_103142 [Kwoniella bestiolae CBS 10118]|uniref:Protein CPL1-like domain-containing protein n=1 Tax=Kwoniella bestiolae CBS 10118 TaxID=1296100 RepID=A0A1B9G7K8_9TREE|nr:hypothetical protein I302_01841 [Kwoniella bestiolae CBS 10118]OCF27006.1 hypothetical protein I302_01841 [Kwoniella bestiolae CBS 10118]
MIRLVNAAVLLITCLGVVVRADNAFAGCFSILPSATTQVTGTFSSATACDAACQNNKHSFYQQSTQSCFCTDKYPSEGYFQSGTADACTNPANYDARITHTSFTWSPACYAASPGGLTYSVLTGPDTCLKNCATSLGAVFYVSSTNGNYQCACGQPTSFGATTQCGPGTYFYYYHTAAAASQGLSRKRRLAEERKRSIPAYCPKGLTACQVGGANGAYECIDTNSELEACGGCLYGTLGSTNTTVGQDCTTIPAVLGGVTCENGQCRAYKCKPGYKLVNQQCVTS